jgi:hypothetical protein
LNGNISRYEEKIHPETDRGDVLVIGEGRSVYLESLNFLWKPLLLRGNFTRYGQNLHLDNDRSVLVFGEALCRLRHLKTRENHLSYMESL